MEKTELMKNYETENGLEAVNSVYTGWDGLDVRSNDDYITWLESELIKARAKAEAYDRLMSGGKKTLKEWANFTGYVTAVQDNGVGIASRDKPIIVEELGDTGWYPTEADIEAYHYFTIHESLIDYSGDWKDSLTLPDGWEAKQ